MCSQGAEGAGRGSDAEGTATKVETQAAALLAAQPSTLDASSTPKSRSSAPLSSLVVSVGRLPTEMDVNADNIHEAFRKIHDPVPRPVGADTSEVLVSVYSRFLRHSESSISGANSKWKRSSVSHASFMDGSIAEDRCADSAESLGIPHRSSEDISVLSEAQKKVVWSSTVGRPQLKSLAPAGRGKDASLLGRHPHQERQEAAKKLENVANDVPGVIRAPLRCSCGRLFEAPRAAQTDCPVWQRQRLPQRYSATIFMISLGRQLHPVAGLATSWCLLTPCMQTRQVTSLTVHCMST